MPKLREIKISNFRGLENLVIKDFSKVNLFVGKNNSGKTTILEALVFLFGMSNPTLPHNINLFRGIGIKTDSAKQLLYFFNKLTTKNKPSFSGQFDNKEERTLNFEPIYSSNTEHKSDIQNSANLDIESKTHTEITGINFAFSINQKSYKTSILLQNNFWKIGVTNDYEEKLFAFFITNAKNDEVTLLNYSKILERNDKKDKNYILELLQNVDKNITNIQILTGGIYFELENVNTLVPINIMGDGIRRLLHIITAVISRQSSFVCVDEIENGLHFSAYELLWEGLLDLSEKYDVQLFISTHSLETISYLKSLLEEEKNKQKQSFVKVFTVARTEKEGYKTYGYSYEGFESAINNGIEIRS
ncbi:MAG: AAA family ATPase [Endomicrobium sp.]|jgi:AAA15 family ATPase/GTPase|nr:AAA family ATPase [Endomicrobium sp.]